MFDTQAIPNEIFVGVFSVLVDKRPYLTSLSLVSRRFHALVEPILYKYIIITQTTPAGIARFLRTILSRPIFASYVRHLDASWIYITPLTLASDPGLQDPTDLALFTAAATNVGLLRAVDLPAAQVALLLHLLPNLLVLKVDPPGEFYPWQYPDVFEKILGEYTVLPTEDLPVALRSVRAITFGPDGSEVSFNALRTIMRLPYIREIDIHILAATEEIKTSSLTSAGNDATSTATSLRFGYGTIDTMALARILAMPQALTRFSYNDYDGRMDSFNCGVFWTGLQGCRETLQVLELWFRMAGTIDNDGALGKNEGALHGWPVLKSVRCQLATLLGKDPQRTVARLADVVPVVMTDLTIDDDEYWKFASVADQVLEMVVRKGCRQLVNVTVGGCWRTGDGSVQEALRAACDAADVLLVGFKWREY